jgi:spore germination protein GerM
MRRLVLAVLVAAIAGGCGVPTDKAPQALPRADVPFDLLAPAATSATSTSLVAVTTEVPVYLVGPDRLVVVRRLVESPSSLFRALESLLAGPIADESAAGVRSAISNQTRLLSVRVQSGVATIDLSGDFAAIGGRDQILAVAQLVYTATAAPGVLGVRLSLDGKPVEVPRGDGTLTQEPLNPGDYSGLAPQ